MMAAVGAWVLPWVPQFWFLDRVVQNVSGAAAGGYFGAGGAGLGRHMHTHTRRGRKANQMAQLLRALLVGPGRC